MCLRACEREVKSWDERVRERKGERAADEYEREEEREERKRGKGKGTKGAGGSENEVEREKQQGRGGRQASSIAA